MLSYFSYLPSPSRCCSQAVDLTLLLLSHCCSHTAVLLMLLLHCCFRIALHRITISSSEVTAAVSGAISEDEQLANDLAQCAAVCKDFQVSNPVFGL